MMKYFLFPDNARDRNFSFFLLAMRLLFGSLLMSHGIQKLCNYSALAAGAFPDPLGIGAQASVSLAIFGELVCAFAFIIGFLYRLSMIPMMVTMIVAFGAVHGWSIADGELAFVYLIVFVFMYLAGPGRISIDYAIRRKCFRR